MRIKLFTDFACPFCLVERRILSGFDELDVESIYMEIHPEVPEDGDAARAVLNNDYINAVNKKLALYGTPYGVEPILNDFISNSKRSIVARAYIMLNYPEKLNDYEEAVYEAYNVNGIDIGNSEVLDDILSTIGIDYPVREMLMDRKAKDIFESWKKQSYDEGIRITPTIMIGNAKYSGLLQEDELSKIISEVENV